MPVVDTARDLSFGRRVKHLLTLAVSGIPAQQTLQISLRPTFGRARWCLGDTPGTQGISIRRPAGQPSLSIAALRVNPVSIRLTAGAAIGGAELTAFVETDTAFVGGLVQVPPGAQLTIQSGIDLVNVVGVSSWYLMIPGRRPPLESEAPPPAKPQQEAPPRAKPPQKSTSRGRKAASSPSKENA